MGYERVAERPSVVYHYTKRENLPSILKDGRIKRMGDTLVIIFRIFQRRLYLK